MLNQISFQTFPAQKKAGLCSGPEECKLISSDQNFPVLTDYTTCTSESRSEGRHLNTEQESTIPQFFKSTYEKDLDWFPLAYNVHLLLVTVRNNTKQLLFSIYTQYNNHFCILCSFFCFFQWMYFFFCKSTFMRRCKVHSVLAGSHHFCIQ